MTAFIRFIRPNSMRESERECWDANEMLRIGIEAKLNIWRRKV